MIEKFQRRNARDEDENGEGRHADHQDVDLVEVPRAEDEFERQLQPANDELEGSASIASRASERKRPAHHDADGDQVEGCLVAEDGIRLDALDGRDCFAEHGFGRSCKRQIEGLLRFSLRPKKRRRLRRRLTILRDVRKRLTEDSNEDGQDQRIAQTSVRDHDHWPKHGVERRRLVEARGVESKPDVEHPPRDGADADGLLRQGPESVEEAEEAAG